MLVREVREGCERLRSTPSMGTSRPDLGPGLRSLFLQNRVVVVYEVAGRDVVIIGVFSGGQDYATLLQTEPGRPRSRGTS